MIGHTKKSSHDLPGLDDVFLSKVYADRDLPL